jgi:penicillin V acylase-like amidase (Ntn superfamily)
MSITRRAESAQLLAVLVVASLLAGPAEACTRALYDGLNGRILTGRTMDWKDDIQTNLWILPRGAERDGAAGSTGLKWTAKYGSLVATGYDIATADGMNEAGLVVNGQWMTESKYPEADGKTPTIALSVFGQFLLDQFGNVGEAVAWLRANPLLVLSGEVPGRPGSLAVMHFSLSDASGDSAIIEWIDGKTVIHHDRAYRVMTNEPAFEQQLAVTAYWQQISGVQFLPGTNKAYDRFARASFYLDAVTKSDDPRVAAAATFSIMRNVSVPIGITTPDRPNISSTRWRVVADHKDRLYYFESTVSPNVFWIDLKKVDFAAAKGVRKLDLGVNQSTIYSGESSAAFKPAAAFTFKPAI